MNKECSVVLKAQQSIISIFIFPGKSRLAVTTVNHETLFYGVTRCSELVYIWKIFTRVYQMCYIQRNDILVLVNDFSEIVFYKFSLKRVIRILTISQGENNCYSILFNPVLGEVISYGADSKMRSVCLVRGCVHTICQQEVDVMGIAAVSRSMVYLVCCLKKGDLLIQSGATY